jgi:outer membrane protein OmpA-like peptidoglycan-associated protein
VRSFLVLVFRLLLLGVGGSIALLVGIAIAQFYPAQVEEPPLLERIIRRSSEAVRWVRGESNPSATETPAIPAPIPESSPLPEVSDAARPKLQEDATRLQQELDALAADLTALEQQIGIQAGAGSLESRLQTVQRAIDPESVTQSEIVEPASPGELPTVAVGETAFLVTLPSDALFASDQRSLSPSASAILEDVARELQRFPGATVRISAHTDSRSSQEGDRGRAYLQANAVEQYLQDAVEGNFHWFVVSYGSQQPIAENDTDANRQRNRRIEIAIVPR